MSCGHCLKKPAAREPEPRSSIRELVTQYGDRWYLMGGSGTDAAARFRTNQAEQTTDSHELFHMKRMELGKLDRCGVLWGWLDDEEHSVGGL